MSTSPQRVRQGRIMAKRLQASRDIRGSTPLSPSELFWSKVQKTDGCWNWMAATRNKNRYGAFKTKGKIYSAHRFSWILTHGEIPEGKLVCHHCDNKLCVRPDHLFLGNYRDNTQDAIQKGVFHFNTHRTKGSFLRGEKHTNAKLRNWQVSAIRFMYALGIWTYRDLARFFSIDYSYIGHIVHRRSRILR